MYGAAALRSYLRHHIALARWFAAELATDHRFELAAPQRFGLVCFRCGCCASASMACPRLPAVPIASTAPADTPLTHALNPQNTQVRQFCSFRVRLRGVPREVNAALLEALNASGRTLLVHTELAGQFTLRLAIGGASTQLEHVQEVWGLIRETAGSVLAAHAEAQAAVRSDSGAAAKV
jgi:aromatic-L-amino-acid decarboxylase